MNRAGQPEADFSRHLLIALFLGGLVAVCYHLVDRPAAFWVRGLDPAIVAVFKDITVFGSSTPYLIVLAALYPALRWFFRRALAAKRALFVLAAIVVSGLAVDLVKPLVARWRPKAFFAEPSQYGFEFFKTGYEHYSFPSGHATTALAVACALALLYPRYRALWFGAGVLVAASRVLVGAHFPGDVLAGGWFGVVVTLALSRTVWFREVLEAPGNASQNSGKPTSGDT